jgi:hypothetical protein
MFKIFYKVSFLLKDEKDKGFFDVNSSKGGRGNGRAFNYLFVWIPKYIYLYIF